MRLHHISNSLVRLAIVLFIVAIPLVAKGDSTKADNTNALNDPNSWLNTTVPGPTDVALWNNSLVTAANATDSVGGSLTWGQVQIADPAANVVIIDSAGTNTLTLNGVGGLGINLIGNRNLTIGATGVNTADSVGLVLGANQSWNVPTGRTLTLNGKHGIAFGANVVTVTGGGTLNYNPSNLFAGTGTATAATSSAGAGVVINGSTLSITIQAGGGSASYTNWMGASTTLTMAGGMMNAAEVANSGTHKQTWTGLTLNPGASSFTMSTRTSSSGIVNYFSAVTRNAGAVADFASTNITNGAGNNVQLYGLAGTAVVGWGTFGTNDFLKLNGATGASTVGAATYVNDTWATGNNTTVTTNDNFSAGSVLTTDSLRFNAAGAFTVTLPTGLNVINSGGILNGGTTAANTSTITGGSLTSGNSGLYGGTGADLIVFSNSATGRIAINSNIVDNGATAIGLTKAGPGELQLGGTNTFTGPSYINTGTVTITNSHAWDGNSVLNFGSTGSTLAAGSPLTNSGTFSVNGNNITTNGLATTFAGVNAFVQNSNAAPGSLTVNVASGNNTYAGTIRDGAGVGSFALTKTGAGSLTLSGSTLSYTGNTNVSAGSLILKAAVPASTNFNVTGSGVLDVTALGSGLTLSSGKTLAGSGTVSGLVSINAGTVMPGVSGTGTLTTTSLITAANSVLNFGLVAGNPTNNLINVTGSGGLNLSAGAGFNLFQAGTSNAFFTNGTYDLFQYTGAAPSLGALSGSSIINAVNGLSYAWGLGSASGNNYVQLTISGTPLLVAAWNSDSNGNWSDASKWTSVPTPGQVPSNPQETANFTTALSATRTVTLNGSRSVGVINFNSGGATNGYVVANGSGTLILDNGSTSAKITNTLGNNTISAPLAVGASTPAVVVTVSNASDTLTLSGGIAPTSAALSVIGPGTLALAGTNNYSGNTTVGTVGTLQFASGSLGSGGITLDNGTLKWGTTNTDDISNRPITFASGGATFHTNGNNVTLVSPIGNFGSGNFTKAGSGTLTLGGVNTYTGQTTVAGGTLSISADANLGGGSGTVQVTTSDTASATVTLTSATLPQGFVVGSALLGQTVTAINGTTVTLSGNANTAISSDTPVSWARTPNLNLNGGTLLATSNFSLQEANQSGAPAATQNRNILLGVSGGGINVADTMTLTVDGTITGATVLTKTGNGTLAISNTANTVPITVSGGTLTGANTNTGNGGFGTGQITLQGGGTINSLMSTNTLIFGNNLVVPTGQTGNITWPTITRWGDRAAPAVAPTITGGGTLNVVLTSGVELNNDFTGFAGNLNFSGTGTIQARINGGLFNNASLVGATVDLGGSVSLQAQTNSGGNTINIGALSGSSPTAILGGTTNGAGSPTWSVGALNTSTTFAGSIQGNAALTKVGTGTLTLAGNSTNTGVTTISAGTLQLGSPTVNAGASGSAGTGNIVNNAALVFNRSDTALAISGVISGTGTVTQSGSGTTSLTGANTYSGNTTINAGTLALNNLTGSGTGTSAVNVNSGGALGGTGISTGVITVASGGIVAPGFNGVGTLTVGSLSLSSGSILNYELQGNAQPSDLTTVTAANGLTINSAGINLYQPGTTTAFTTNGVYNLIGFNGAIGGNGTLSVLNPDVSKSYTFGSAGGFLTLTILPSAANSIFWNVDASSTWNTPSNWTGNNVPNAPGVLAAFGGGGTPITASRTITVNAPETVGALQFNNPTFSYIISGSNTLTLDGSGSAAVINVVAGSHTISAPLAANSDVFVNVTNAADTFTISGAISGSMSNFSKSGVGTLVLSGGNTYSATNNFGGGTVLLSGTGQRLGSTGNTLNMTGGTLDLGTSSQTVGTLNYSGGDILHGTLTPTFVTFTGPGTSNLSSNLVGSTSLNINGTATGKLVLGGSNTFTGAAFLNTGTLSVSADSNLGDPTTSSLNLIGGTFQVTGTSYHAFAANRQITSYSSAFDIADPANIFTINPGSSASGAALVKLGTGKLVLGNSAGPVFYDTSRSASVRAGTLELQKTDNGQTADFSFGTTQQVAANGAAPPGIEIAPAAAQTATVTVGAGTRLVADRVIIGGNQGNSDGGSATLTVNGGQIDSAQWFTVGSAGTGTSTANLNGAAVVNVNSAGNATVNTQLEVADFGASSGTLNINDTTHVNIQNNGNISIGVQGGNTGIGTVNQNGGTVTPYLDSGTTPGGTGALRIGSAGTGTYTYNLNGGKLYANTIVGATGTRVFNFNGGTLVPMADATTGAMTTPATATFSMTGLTRAQISTGGAIIDTSGAPAGSPASGLPVSVTIAQGLVKDPALAANVDDGGLNVIGGGTLTLTGTGTFTGNTTVAAGTNLIVSATAAAGPGLGLQNSRLATLPGATGLQFSSFVTSHNFTIGGFASSLSNSSTFNMLDNGGAPLNLSVGGTGVTSSYGGTLAGVGATLIKVGTGTLSFSGTNTYTGTTTVSAGTLNINGTHTGGGAYTVNNGGTLGGTGTIPEAITVNSGGAINPGASIGTLHPTGAVSLASGGILRTELQGSLSDILDLGSTGTLNITSGAVANFSLLSNITTTQFVFAKYAGSNLTGSFGTPTFTPAANVPTPTLASITNDTVNHQLVLTVSPQSLRGNFSLDNTVTTADIPAMLSALTDLTAYKAAHPGIADSDLLALGDFDNNGVLNNLDIQGMLNYIGGLGAGSGGTSAVPEPASIVLSLIGGLALMAGVRRRTSTTMPVA